MQTTPVALRGWSLAWGLSLILGGWWGLPGVPVRAGAAEPSSGAPEPEDCAPLLRSIREEFRLPALAAAVVLGDRLVSLGATGVRRASSAKQVTPADRFHIGSITKSMTATLAARLVEEGKIRWDSTLAEVFPDRARDFHAAYRRVTLHQLLAHRGGMPASLEQDGLWDRLWTLTTPPRQQRLYLLEQVACRPPAAPPGSEFLYSNAGYAVAGAMLEQVTDIPWEELMRKLLFEPLGMRTAGFGAPATPATLDQPWGHVPRNGKYQPVPPGPRADNPPAIAPAGAVHCSLPDLARYTLFHLRGARGHEDRLERGSFARLHTPLGDETHALGWLVVQRDWAGGRALTHAGSNTMFYAVVWLAPERNFAVLVATNAGGSDAERACDRAAWALIQHWLRPTSSP